MSTESLLTRCLADLNPYFGLEPLTIFIDQRNQGNRFAADVKRQVDHIVLRLHGRNVEFRGVI